jgi:hypothetical protein
MSIDANGSQPAEVVGEAVCHHKGGIFCGHAVVTFDVLILQHPVFNWRGCMWHIFRRGDPGGGNCTCIRRGKWNKGGIWGGDQGGRGA